MKKKFLAIFLVILLVVTNQTISYADEDVVYTLDDLTNVNIGNYGENLNNGFDPTDTGVLNAVGSEVGEAASGIMKVIIKIFTWIPEQLIYALLQIIALFVPMMDIIVFDEGVSIWKGVCDLSYFDAAATGMAGNMRVLVSTIYQAFRYVALIGFIIAIACIAVKMIISSVGKQKAQYKEALKNWVIGLVLLVVGHWIMIYTIYFSDYLVSLIKAIKNAVLYSWNPADFTTTGNTLMAAFADAAAGTAIKDMIKSIATLNPGPIIGWAISTIFACLAFAWMNMKIFKIYLERVIIVGVLIMLFPLVTVFYAFEKAGIKKGDTFATWLRIFMDQVFIQPVHAVSLLFVIIAINGIASTPITGIPIVGMIIILMVVNMMFSIEPVVKRVFSISGAGLGQPMDATGTAFNSAAAGRALGAKFSEKGAEYWRTGKGKEFLDTRHANRLAKLKAYDDKHGTDRAGKYQKKIDNRPFADRLSRFGARENNLLGMLNAGNLLTDSLGAAGFKIPDEFIPGKHSAAEVKKAKAKLKEKIKLDDKGNMSNISEQDLRIVLESMDQEEVANLLASGNLDKKKLYEDPVAMRAVAVALTRDIDNLGKLQTDGKFDENLIKGYAIDDSRTNAVLEEFIESPQTIDEMENGELAAIFAKVARNPQLANKFKAVGIDCSNFDFESMQKDPKKMLAFQAAATSIRTGKPITNFQDANGNFSARLMKQALDKVEQVEETRYMRFQANLVEEDIDLGNVSLHADIIRQAQILELFPGSNDEMLRAIEDLDNNLGAGYIDERLGQYGIECHSIDHFRQILQNEQDIDKKRQAYSEILRSIGLSSK